MDKNSQAVIPDNIIVVEGDGLNPVPTPEAGDAGKVLGVLNSSGDIGWVEDQGGTLTQVQSDWAETDSSKVSYIDNKPDLSVYATTSAVNTALAGKQDTISDLSEIRAGAAKGDTALQPSALDDYATTSAMNTALAGKQDTISDLATIRSGAAAGATAVQPGSLATVATTGSYSDLSNKPTIPTKGSLMVKSDTTQKELYDAWAAGWTIQSNRGNELNVYELTHFEHEYDEYTAIFSRVYFADALIYEDSFAIDGITDSTSAVTFGSKTTKTSNRVPDASSQTVGKVLTIKSVPNDDPIASWETPATPSVDEVPDVTSTDDGKVLTASYSGGQGSYSWQTAQGGGGGGASYTAGDGIGIDANNVISADVDGSTIGIDSTTKKIKLLSTIPSVDQTYSASSTHAQSGTAVAQAIASIPSSSYTAGDGIKISNNTISADFTEVQSALDFSSDFTFENPTQYTSTTASSGYWVVIPTDAATKFTLPGTLGNWPSADGTVTVQLQVGSGSTWTTLKSGSYSTLASLPSDFYTDVEIPAGLNGKYIRWFCTYTYMYMTQNVELYIYNFDTTANCFTVPGTGTLALADPLPYCVQEDSGKVLKVNASGNAEWGTDGFTTTAGITDIQQVAALPANPVATVLYLIPET